MLCTVNPYTLVGNFNCPDKTLDIAEFEWCLKHTPDVLVEVHSVHTSLYQVFVNVDEHREPVLDKAGSVLGVKSQAEVRALLRDMGCSRADLVHKAVPAEMIGSPAGYREELRLPLDLSNPD